MAKPSEYHGWAVLLGAGTGEAGLITAAGIHWLSQCNTVIYDRLVDPAILDAIPPNAERIFAGKAPGQPGPSQEDINALLVEKVRAGRRVVRLKGGDPLIFGRGGEEADALAEAGLEFRILPGVTAAATAAAFAGIPLTDRRLASSVTFVTAHEDPQKQTSSLSYDALARMGTLVFYMTVRNLPDVAERLIRAGRSPHTPAAVVQEAGTPRQQKVTADLATIASRAVEAGITPPAVLIVGEVVSLHERLDWFCRLPLRGKTILLTRPEERNVTLRPLLEAHGATVLPVPTIIIAPPEDIAPLDEALRHMREYDWVVLTSPSGAEMVLDRLGELGLDARTFGPARIAAIGESTRQALARGGLRADLVPEPHTTEALSDALTEKDVSGSRLLLLRSDLAEPALADRLQQAGATVHDVTAYRTICPDALPDDARDSLCEGRVDWITATSPSCVRNLLRLMGEDQPCLQACRFACIGPVTARALRAEGFEPAAVAEPHTAEGLAAAILAAESTDRFG